MGCLVSRAVVWLGGGRMGSQNQQILAKEQGWVLIAGFNFVSDFKLVKYLDLLS